MTYANADPDREPARGDATLVEFSTRVVGSLLEQLAALDVDLLLVGERGVGKERIAREVHYRSPRRTGAFVVLNCEIRPTERLATELFGAAAAATPSRARLRHGALADAAGGTLYLDEINALLPQTQARLLDAFETQQLPSDEGSQPGGVFPRIIASAVTDIGHLVSAGRFRLDLYERLRAVALAIPPLRHRRDELPDLVLRLLAHYAGQYGGDPVSLAPETMQRLVAHSWPGNLPQLENIIERIALHRSDAWVAEELERASALNHLTHSRTARERRAGAGTDTLRDATASIALPSAVLAWPVF